jgi:peptidoglycan/xylan/chitin deacetylase (PgdA/CDA1 family)
MTGKLANFPRILTFHNTAPSFTCSSTNYSPHRVFALCESLIATGYHLCDLDDLLDSPGPDRIAITFDDAYDSMRQVIPRLIDDFQVHPTVFVPTAFIGRTNVWDYGHRLAPQRHLDAPSLLQLADLGVQFGAHGHNHLDLTRLPLDQASHELSRSKAALEELLDREISLISYPFGRTSPEVVGAAVQAGYRHGFTMAYPSADDKAMAVGRIAVYCFDTPLAVRNKLSRGFGRRVEAFKAGLTNRLSHGTTVLNRIRRTFTKTT